MFAESHGHLMLEALQLVVDGAKRIPLMEDLPGTIIMTKGLHGAVKEVEVPGKMLEATAVVMQPRLGERRMISLVGGTSLVNHPWVKIYPATRMRAKAGPSQSLLIEGLHGINRTHGIKIRT